MKRLTLCLCGLALLLGASVALAQQHGGPGLFQAPLYAGKQMTDLGSVSVWNSPKKLMVQVNPAEGWELNAVHLWYGYDAASNIPSTKKGNPIPGKFPYKKEFDLLVPQHKATFDLKEDLDFSWGSQSQDLRLVSFAVHVEVVKDGKRQGAWAHGPTPIASRGNGNHGWIFTYLLSHPMRGQFIDSPVKGLGYHGPTQQGMTGYDEMGNSYDEDGNEIPSSFPFFPGEYVDFAIGSVPLGTAPADKKVSPLDLFNSADTGDPRVIGVARVLQTLDFDSGAEQRDGKITITPNVAACFSRLAIGNGYTDDDGLIDWGDGELIDELLVDLVSPFDPLADPPTGCNGAGGAILAAVAPDAAQEDLESGLNASGIFRKNITKTEDLGETKQKLDVMPVYFPALRSDGSPSVCCIDETDDGIDDCDPKLCDLEETPDIIELCEGDPGVAYEEWRLGGDPLAEECDPRIDLDENGVPDGDEGTCVITLIECREVAKPIVVTYMEIVDIHDDQVTTDFADNRFAWDTFTAVSRDDGNTWKRMNVSRMADLSSFELETGEPFPGTVGSPYLKVNDNYILNVWESKYCKSGNPRYAITTCDDPATEEVEVHDPSYCEGPGLPDPCCTGDGTGTCGCAIYCNGNPDNDTEVCEEDYPFDDDYAVTDIWGVRGQQQSVDYDEVDDVAELGIGEIPYSCLWAARGVIVTQQDLDLARFESLNVDDDPATGDVDETQTVGLGDIIWFKPERLTSGRRDAYVPVLGSARGAGFAIAWQEDPDGLRPGKGKGPGEGWSGAISNHKSDIWYSYVSFEDFAMVDENFVPGGPAGGTDTEPDGDEGYLDKTGLGRPKAMVPFSLPVRISDNDMVNTHTLKVEPSADCPTFPDSTGLNTPVCFPEVVDGSFVPIDPEEIAAEFCGHPDADPATCCDPDNHEGDPNCEDLKGLYGNMTGTKRYATLARSIDDNGDGVPDYQYYVDRGGTLDLCDLSGTNSFMDMMPGTSEHERWFGFTNVAGADKLVCVTSDGRLLDGDVFASRPMLQLQPYTKPDGTKSAWALLAYEESKGMGHSLAAEEHTETDVGDELIGDQTDDSGQEKPIKQDLGKNMLYHSFDYTQPDLVHPGHIVNLPAICGGLYPTWCDDRKTEEVEDNPENPTCTCTPGDLVPLYFDYLQDTDNNPDTPDEWIPDDTKFLQYRTEIARRARFLMQSPGKMGPSKALGAIIFKQGQEGQGRPADVFIRRFVKKLPGNPYQFGNMECTTYIDESTPAFLSLKSCPNDNPAVSGYNCNIWGEATGDRLCGGVFTDPNGEYPRRDHINLTSADIDLAVGVGPEDDTPDDPTDDVYNRNKVLLWSQYERNLGDESFGWLDGVACDPLATEDAPGEVCPGMYSNARSHRGFIRGDFFVIAYSLSPNWAAGRNGNDRYNFYTRRSFDGGKTWTTDPDGDGVYVCPEFRTDPYSPDPDGSGNLPPDVLLNEDGEIECGTYAAPDPVPDDDVPPEPVGIAMTNYLDPIAPNPDGVSAQYIEAGEFEPARNVSELKSNHESSGDPRLGTTPPTYPLDGRGTGTAGDPLPILRFVEDEYINNMFFVAWGTVDNAKSTGSSGVKAEAGPLDLFYTRTENYGDSFIKLPWVIGGETSNQAGETVWRYEHLAKGEPEEQGECQLKATSDGSKAYVIWHSTISAEEDPDVEHTRYYPWKPSESTENDLWFRRLIFWPDAVTTMSSDPEEASTEGDSSTEGDTSTDGPAFDEGGDFWDGGTVDPIDPVVEAFEPQVVPMPTDEMVLPPSATLPTETVSEPMSPTPAYAEIEAPAAEPRAATVAADTTLNVQPRSYVPAPYGKSEEVEDEEGEGGDADEEESACEMYAVFELTSDGLEMRAVYHHELPGELDPYEPVTEWHEWERALSESPADAIWLRQWILCDEEVTLEETVTE